MCTVVGAMFRVLTLSCSAGAQRSDPPAAGGGVPSRPVPEFQ